MQSRRRSSEADVAVLGAGVAGLAAARDLAAAGLRVVVLEAAGDLGGLASSIEVHGEPLERFHHFVCRGDRDLMVLLEELGLGGRLRWRPSLTSFFHRGRLYPFSAPLDLLRFTAVPPLQRLRFGLNVIHSRHRRRWEELDRVAAADWLERRIGREAYEVIWDPLLRIKFGDAHRSVSAAWIWHRIHRVAASRSKPWRPELLGTLDGGSATVVDALAEDIGRRDGAGIRTGTSAERVETADGRVAAVRLVGGERVPCRAVLSTVALPLLLRLAPDLPADESRRLAEIDYLGVVCILLVLRRSVSPSFWVNVNDPEIPFNGFIEYSNLDRRIAGRAVVYVPHYLPTSHPRYGADDGRLVDEAVEGLARIRPGLESSWVEEAHVSRARHAQAICTVGFSRLAPGHRTGLPGLYLTDSAQFYPEDRTISAAVRLGRTVAGMIRRDL